MGALIHYIPNDCYCHLKLPGCFAVIITRFGVLTAVYYAMSHRILPCMDNCCITWMWYISLSGQLLLPLSGALVVPCQFFGFACSLQALTGGTNWRGYTLTHACGDGLHWRLLICCLLRRNQIRPCILWWNFPSCLVRSRTWSPDKVWIPLLWQQRYTWTQTDSPVFQFWRQPCGDESRIPPDNQIHDRLLHNL